MHILFLTDNFPPESNAPASRTFEHARVWAKNGHKVTVITCAPNFPEGVVYPGYKNHWFSKEYVEEIEVRRVKTFISSNSGVVRRILDHQSFMVSGFLAGLRVQDFDVVVATSPQFFTACAGWAVAKCKRRPFVFEVRDLWPESISSLGVITNSLILNALRKIELFLYKRAKAIVVVTHQFKAHLTAMGIEPEKIETILNGADLRFFLPKRKDLSLVRRYELENKFVVGYVGTHGMAHALETILQAAKLLRDREDIVFLFAGGGAHANRIKRLAAEQNLDNVRVIGRQDKSLMPSIWSLCDISIVHLKNTALFSKVIPSKIFESMAMGVPLIIGVPKGEATSLVEAAKAGVVIEPEEPQQLVNAVLELKKDPELLQKYKDNCLANVGNYDRDKLAIDMLESLMKIK